MAATRTGVGPTRLRRPQRGVLSDILGLLLGIIAGAPFRWRTRAPRS